MSTMKRKNENEGSERKEKVQKTLTSIFGVKPKKEEAVVTQEKIEEKENLEGKSETNIIPSVIPAPLPNLNDTLVQAFGFNTWQEIIGDSWYSLLGAELNAPYMKRCTELVAARRKTSSVYPPPKCVFQAFKSTPIDKLTCVIFGQDPYHQPNQAMGLCFSVNKGIKVPPSLKNIYKELGITCDHGDISSWSTQGVLLLNSILTVEDSKPMSHKDFGWEKFTDAVVAKINEKLTDVVFLLWGKPAQLKAKCVNNKKHHLLMAGHPSPLSVRFFLGCDHFNKANEILKSLNKKPIDWTDL